MQRSTVFVGGSALVIALILGACSDDHPPSTAGATGTPTTSGGGGGSSSGSTTSSSGSTGGVPTDGATGTTDSGTDAGPDEDICAPLTQLSQVVGAQYKPGTAPAATGGTIAPGAYALTEIRWYEPAPPSEGAPPPPMFYGRSTLRFSANGVRFLETRGTDPDALPAATTAAYKEQVDGTTLKLTGTCSTTAPTERTYSVSGNILFFHVSATRLDVFSRRP